MNASQIEPCRCCGKMLAITAEDVDRMRTEFERDYPGQVFEGQTLLCGDCYDWAMGQLEHKREGKTA